MSFDTLVKSLRGSVVGRIYRAHLRQFALGRWVARRIVHGIRSYYLAVLRFQAPLLPLRPLSFIRLGKAVAYRDETVLLRPPETVHGASARWFPHPPTPAAAAPAPYEFPAITAVTLRDATAHGGCNFITVGDTMIHHDLYDFLRDATTEELHARCIIHPFRKTIHWSLRETALAPLPAAAVFLDGCAANYAHWMTEVLPRIAIFCATAAEPTIPLLVNDGLHANLRASLALVAGDHPVITVPLGQSVAVGRLVVVSPTGYISFGHRRHSIKPVEQGIFSPYALSLMRSRLMERAAPPTRGDYPKRVYVKRNSGGRVLTNAAAVEAALVAQGFAVIEPEKLSFAEQIHYFAKADILVAATGAACVNLLFCRPGARLVVLMAQCAHMPYDYWYNMAAAVNVRVNYVLGNKVRYLHDDFRVRLEDVLDSVAQVQ